MTDPQPRRYTVSVDLDGVLHQYVGWKGAEHYEPPIVGAIPWLESLTEDYTVVIHTTRAMYPGVEDSVNAWLTQNGYDGPRLLVTNQKLPSIVYIDDRAFRFEGTNFPSPITILNMRPWWK